MGRNLIYLLVRNVRIVLSKKLYNEALSGTRIQGTVKRMENESVYIQLSGSGRLNKMDI